ncbi:DNA repair protein [Colletotrichum plurivorum]|uniref:Postreplication repair E3 ubiquitin-protein ligase RAD18 n=1 Tax=Colletotrichum plurivorum TaxID=2175906 RepID=A0A8H6K5X0_9PEZI|nr:DNA repair protein [Colletotrichum plurivorum]
MADSNFDDVPDSTDWLATPLPGLSTVEAALRCQICKDFFKTPMLTSCSHTFCSLCIRRALSNDGKCPLCRASDEPHKLRSNWSMEEVVESFNKARKEMLQFARTAGQRAAAGPSSPKRKHAEDPATSGQQPEAKRLRSSARLTRSRSGQNAAPVQQEENDVYQPEEVDEDDEAGDETFAPDDGMVPCPICQTRMKQFQVFRHLDTCPGQQPQTAPRSSSSRTPTPNTPAGRPPYQRQAPPPERLPALNYSMLKDVALRKKMSDLGLSTNGARLHLEKRHKEWITLWNANCDSAHPKSRRELLHDLDVWERTQGAKAPVLVPRAGTAVKDKEFDGAAWAAKHDTSFKDLIANARKSREQAKQKAEAAAADEQKKETPESGSSGASGAEVAMVGVTEPSIATTTTPAAAEGDGTTVRNTGVVPAATYYMQDGFSEPRIPPVEVGTSSQEAR